MNIHRARLGGAFAFAAAVLLAACSSGDGAKGECGNTSHPPPPPEPPPVGTTTAEGAFAGTLTPRGFRLSLIVLENGVAWGLYENNGLLVGFFEGVGVSNNGSYTIPDVRDHDFVDRTARRSQLSATYFPALSIEGHLIPDVGVQSAFSATAAAMTGYDYAQPAAPGQVTGSWPGFYRNGFEYGTVRITSSGAISATTSAGCAYTGTVVPRASGRNVFDVRISFGSAPCELPDGVATGIAIVVQEERSQHRNR
ncbi:MAG TPA: hypothetical protein PK177_23015, partial [Burkholderiaceae bacterium]|nr:hypothetical protein [Burkholderiaceae bacterium]